MDELKLIRPTTAYAEQIRSYRDEFLANGDSMDGTSSLKTFDDPSEWLTWTANMARGETCPDNWVPSIQHLCIRTADDRLIGMIDTRLELNDFLFNYGGHIGYSTRKSERRKGYATKMLALCLNECLKIGLERVLITCDRENIASARTILKNGGILENEVPEDGGVTQRYWITL